MASIHICLIDNWFAISICCLKFWWIFGGMFWEWKGGWMTRFSSWKTHLVDGNFVIVDFCMSFRIFIQFFWLESSQWGRVTGLIVIWRKIIAEGSVFCQLYLWKKIQRNNLFVWSLIFQKLTPLGHKIQMEIDNLTLFHTLNSSFVT